MKKKSIFILLSAMIIWLPSQGVRAVNVAYDLGVFALDEGDLNAAEQQFLKAVGQEPDNPYCNQFLGKTYLQMGRYDDALHYFDRAWDLMPSLIGLEYDRGMAQYKAGNYEQATAIFSDLAAKDPANALAVYYTGMSYFKQQQYRTAIKYLNMAADQNSSIRDNSYYFAGLSHQRLGETKKALDKLDYVAEFATSDQLRQSAGQWLEVIRAEGAKGVPYSLYLKLGLQYDDNVRLDPLNEDLFADEGDWAIVGFFAGRYNLVNRADRRLGIGYTHYQSRYTDLSEFDLIGSTLSLYVQQRLSSSLTLIGSYLPSFYWLDSDSYLRRHQLRPELLWQPSEGRAIRLSYSYSMNEYFQDSDKDGTSNALGVELYQKVLGQRGQLLVGLGYEKYDADHPDEDYGWFQGRVGYTGIMSWDLKLHIEGTLVSKEYDHVDSYYHEQRKDHKYSVGASLGRQIFFPWLTIQGEYQYTKNDSNIDYFSYDKNVFTVSAITKF
jgi:tetratricopeptide (TPR) repeat protein